MATTTTCKKCGCQDSFLISPAPCPTPADCPNPEPCSEVFDAQCVKYTGDDILCLQNTLVATNDTVADALVSIVDYFCGSDSYISDVELQGTDLIFTGVNLAFDGTVDLASISGSVTANNGLTLATGNIVQLGGTLIKDTTIITVDYDMVITGARVSNADSVLVVSNTGIGGGIYTTSSANNPISAYCSGTAVAGSFVGLLGHGIQATTRNNLSSYAGIFSNVTTLSNSVAPVLQICNFIDGNTLPTDGVGASAEFYIPGVNNSGLKENYTSNQIKSIFNDVAIATLSSQLIFTGRSGGTAIKDLVTFKGDGEVQFHLYGDGTFVSPYTYLLGVDVDGNIVEVVSPF